YYPYPAGYSFGTGFFFGVTTAFVIGWHAHYLHVDPCTYIGHPYYGRHYYAPFYVRRSITVNVNLIDRGHGGYAWRSSPHRPRYAHSTRSAHSERAQHTNRSTGHGPDHSFDHGRASGGPGHDDAGRYRGQYTHRNGNGLLYDARRYSGGHGAPGEHATGSASSLAGKHPSGRSGDSTQTDRSGNSTAGGSTTRPGLRFHTPGRSAPSTHAGMAPRTTQRNRNARPGSQTTAPHVAAPPPGRTIGGIASRTLRPPSPSHSRGSSSGRVQNHGPRASRGHDNGHRSTGNAIRGGRTAER
ncbi:MAG TPA: hypothetical protein VFY39_06030, partial [Gammaproteobacteria bacterium]|nr:hypothetical protein [Gammaproteobacteria bacterium]